MERKILNANIPKSVSATKLSTSSRTRAADSDSSSSLSWSETLRILLEFYTSDASLRRNWLGLRWYFEKQKIEKTTQKTQVLGESQSQRKGEWVWGWVQDKDRVDGVGGSGNGSGSGDREEGKDQPKPQQTQQVAKGENQNDKDSTLQLYQYKQVGIDLDILIKNFDFVQKLGVYHAQQIAQCVKGVKSTKLFCAGGVGGGESVNKNEMSEDVAMDSEDNGDANDKDQVEDQVKDKDQVWDYLIPGEGVQLQLTNTGWSTSAWQNQKQIQSQQILWIPQTQLQGKQTSASSSSNSSISANNNKIQNPSKKLKVVKRRRTISNYGSPPPTSSTSKGGEKEKLQDPNQDYQPKQKKLKSYHFQSQSKQKQMQTLWKINAQREQQRQKQLKLQQQAQKQIKSSKTKLKLYRTLPYVHVYQKNDIRKRTIYVENAPFDHLSLIQLILGFENLARQKYQKENSKVWWMNANLYQMQMTKQQQQQQMLNYQNSNSIQTSFKNNGQLNLMNNSSQYNSQHNTSSQNNSSSTSHPPNNNNSIPPPNFFPQDIYTPLHPRTNLSQGFAFIEYDTEQAWLWAKFTLDGQWPWLWPLRRDGRKLFVLSREEVERDKGEMKEMVNFGNKNQIQNVDMDSSTQMQLVGEREQTEQDVENNIRRSQNWNLTSKDLKLQKAEEEKQHQQVVCVKLFYNNNKSMLNCVQTVLSIRQYIEHAVPVQNVDIIQVQTPNINEHQPQPQQPHHAVIRLTKPEDCFILKYDIEKSRRKLGLAVPKLELMSLEQQTKYWESVFSKSKSGKQNNQQTPPELQVDHQLGNQYQGYKKGDTVVVENNKDRDQDQTENQQNQNNNEQTSLLQNQKLTKLERQNINYVGGSVRIPNRNPHQVIRGGPKVQTKHQKQVLTLRNGLGRNGKKGKGKFEAGSQSQGGYGNGKGKAKFGAGYIDVDCP